TGLQNRGLGVRAPPLLPFPRHSFFRRRWALYRAFQRNIMAIGSPVEFLRQVRQEVGKVTWPTRKETGVTTGLVLLLVVLAAVFFFLVDLGLGHLVRLVL